MFFLVAYNDDDGLNKFKKCYMEYCTEDFQKRHPDVHDYDAKKHSGSHLIMEGIRKQVGLTKEGYELKEKYGSRYADESILEPVETLKTLMDDYRTWCIASGCTKYDLQQLFEELCDKMKCPIEPLQPLFDQMTGICMTCYIAKCDRKCDACVNGKKHEKAKAIAKEIAEKILETTGWKHVAGLMYDGYEDGLVTWGDDEFAARYNLEGFVYECKSNGDGFAALSDSLPDFQD